MDIGDFGGGYPLYNPGDEYYGDAEGNDEEQAPVPRVMSKRELALWGIVLAVVFSTIILFL